MKDYLDDLINQALKSKNLKNLDLEGLEQLVFEEFNLDLDYQPLDLSLEPLELELEPLELNFEPLDLNLDIDGID